MELAVHAIMGSRMISRRKLIAGASAAAFASSLHASPELGSNSTLVNDVHSRLNATHVSKVFEPRTIREVQSIVRMARRAKMPISVAGGRHAMGGQQFGTDSFLVDIRKLNRVLHLDRELGILDVEAGIEWPELIRGYLALQNPDQKTWGIAQKQTGADRLTIAGTIAANAHGRGLTMRPFIDDIESFTFIDESGGTQSCSRTENPELFRLVHGGYGLFGIVTSARLRLVPRTKVERVVEIQSIDNLMPNFAARVARGFQYGDFQFAIDRDSEDFLKTGVFSCYRPVPIDTPIPPAQKELSDENWRQLLFLAHTNGKAAFKEYADYYLSTNGQTYWSDLQQLSIYPENYHQEIDRTLHASNAASEIITEINVPRSRLKDFFEEAREDFRGNDVNLIYGTVRLIERDVESFMPWARESYACTIFNLHTIHSQEGLEHSAAAFRRLIDMAARRGGTYYLTYHRFASREQVLSCYPQFPKFLRLKQKYDPDNRFQSDWYRFYRRMFADMI